MIVSYIGLDGAKEGAIHVQVCKPNAGVEMKGILQIVHGMTEHIGRYTDFAEILCSKGYIVVGCDLSGHGRSINPKNIECLYVDSWKDWVENVETTRQYICGQYPELPIYILGFSLGSFVVRCIPLERLDKYQGVILGGTGYNSALLLSILQAIVSIIEIGSIGTESSFAKKLAFDSYASVFKGKDPLYWLLTDEEARVKYKEDHYVKMRFTAKFFIEFFKCMKKANKCKAIKGKPYMFLSGSLDPVGKNVRTAYKKYYKESGNADLYFAEGYTHDIMHDKCSDWVVSKVLSFMGYKES